MSDEQNVWPADMPKVGQRAELTREVSVQDIEMFTAISEDRNPLHYDAELAGKTKFGGIIVQGRITSAITERCSRREVTGAGYGVPRR
jgi:acyl dehydratase